MNFWLWLWILLGVATLGAHDFSESTSQISIAGSVIRMTLWIDTAGLRGFEAASPGNISIEDVDASIDRVFPLIKAHFRVRAPEEPGSTTLERYDVVDGHVLRLTLVEGFSHEISDVEIVSSLDQITRPDHVHLAVLLTHGTQRRFTLSALNRSRVIEAVGESAPVASDWRPERARLRQVAGYLIAVPLAGVGFLVWRTLKSHFR